MRVIWFCRSNKWQEKTLPLITNTRHIKSFQYIFRPNFFYIIICFCFRRKQPRFLSIYHRERLPDWQKEKLLWYFISISASFVLILYKNLCLFSISKNQNVWQFYKRNSSFQEVTVELGFFNFSIKWIVIFFFIDKLFLQIKFVRKSWNFLPWQKEVTAVSSVTFI